MRYFSTREKNKSFSFKEAALRGLAEDGGLFIPRVVPPYKKSAAASFKTISFLDLAFETVKPYLEGEIEDGVLRDIVESAFNFPAPLVPVGERYVLELFHGPTAAFKDFGARFMARIFSYFRRGEERPLKILVATSGDTGGAVAAGFSGVEGITVTVLYPKGRVSDLQEKQIAGLGGNVEAIAVEGSFDDCQRLVKAAFNNVDLRKKLDMSSANSINIARLVPQTVYWAAGAAQFFKNEGRSGIFCAPSGNFGNLTAGMYAKEMGAPIKSFIAATNINKTFPDFLESGVYKPRESVATISNAMDVGAPSNFERLESQWSFEKLKTLISGAYISDDETRDAIKRVYEAHKYFLDPHGAVGWAAVDKLSAGGTISQNEKAVVLETAHPGKFAGVVEPLTAKIPPCTQLEEAEKRRIVSKTIPTSEDALFQLLLNGSSN